jgi:LysM repeat protein
MRKRPLMIGVLLVFVLCLAAVAAGVYAVRQVPTMSDMIYPGSSPVHVTLQIPAAVSPWPLNSYIPILVTALSRQPIRSVELYINGVLYETKSTPEDGSSQAFTALWNWQPGAVGQFVILARAVDFAGQASLSSPAVLTAIDAAVTTTPIKAQPGDTLRKLSEAHNLPLAQILQENPDLDPDAPIDPDKLIFLPNPPAPVKNLHIIPGYLPFEAGTGNLPPISLVPTVATPGTIGNPPSHISTITPTSPSPASSHLPPVSIIDNLFFWLKVETGNTSSQLPYAPTISGDFKGCTPIIRINIMEFTDPPPGPEYDHNRPKNEDGFFLYRSRDGGAFERIATLPKVVDYVSTQIPVYTNEYEDPNQYGLVTYYLSAFNTAGETPSNPVTLPLDSAGCKDPSAVQYINQIHLKDGDLILPFAMDAAYLYIQINGSAAERVPGGDRTFLPGSGVKFNLDTYLNSIIDKVPQPDLDISMEVWGWSGGKLVYAGKFTTTVHRAVLTVCSVEGKGGCTGSGGGQWVTETNITDQKPLKDQVYEFRWQTTALSDAKSVCYELAAGPFPEPADYWNMALAIYAHCAGAGGQEGFYEMNLGGMLYPPGPMSAGKWGNGTIGSFEYDSNVFQFNTPPGTPFSLFLRFYPRLTMSGFSKFTNTVVFHYNTPPLPSKAPPLASTYPSLYDVEIQRNTYQPPMFEQEEMWGCVIVDEDPTNTLPIGVPICPGKVPPQSDCGDWDLLCLMAGFGKSLAELGNYVIFGINAYKNEIVVGVVDVIPGCKESGKCKDAVGLGVDYGVSALTGLPPTLPDFEDIAAGEIASYVVSEVTGVDPAVGAACAAAGCEDKIKAVLAQRLKQGKSLQSQKACIYGYEAYFHGQQAVCLDPSIIVHPAPGSGNYPGSILVKVTRRAALQKGLSYAAPKSDADKYRLAVNVTAETDSEFYGGHILGVAFQPLLLPIPWMQEGESTILPAILTPCNSPSSFPQSGFCSDYTYTLLVQNATFHMQATETCYSSDSSLEWVPCSNGGRDSWDYYSISLFSFLPFLVGRRKGKHEPAQ